MSLWIGRRMGVGIGVEATRGVGVAPAYWMNCLSFSFKDMPERALSQAGFGGIWGGDQSPIVLTHAEGQIEAEMDSSSIGAILKATFGGYSVSTVDTSAKKHTYTIQNDNIHPALSISTIDPIGQLIFELGMVDTLVLKIVPNEIVSCNVTFKSKGSQDTAANSTTYTTTRKWLGRHLQFKVSTTGTSGLAAASKINNLKSLTLTIKKNTEVNQVLSTVGAEDIVNKRFDVSADVVLNYEDRTWLNYVKNGTYIAARIDLVHDDLAGAATQKYELLFDLSKCSVESFDPAFAMDDVVTQKYTLNALYDAGGNNNVFNNVFLANAIASY